MHGPELSYGCHEELQSHKHCITCRAPAYQEEVRVSDISESRLATENWEGMLISRDKLYK